MIRRTLPEGDLLIPQDEHARQAGRFAALLLEHPGEAVVRAVALHDSGWPCRDDDPRPLPNGRPPHIFDPAYERDVEPWRRSVAIARSVGRLEGLLVSRHFSGFSEEFAAEQAAWEMVWGIGIDPAQEQVGLAVIRLCDALSLAALCDPGTPIRIPKPYSVTDGCVSPWPFRVPSIEDTVVGRVVANRNWPQSDQLGSIYRGSEPAGFTIRLCPSD
jgi:hypothetical protein